MKKGNKIIGAGILTAISASLCCITPVLALLAGTSGVASTFSWIEPFRPYLIGLTLFVLGFAWYQKIKSERKIIKNEIDCDCESNEKSSFFQSKIFLGIITVFAMVMLAFPNYSEIFYPKIEKQTTQINESDIVTSEFKISGMTCASCEIHVDYELNKLSGVANAKTSYDNKNAIVKYDRTKTTKAEITKTINATGYKVIDKK